MKISLPVSLFLLGSLAISDKQQVVAQSNIFDMNQFGNNYNDDLSPYMGTGGLDVNGLGGGGSGDSNFMVDPHSIFIMNDPSNFGVNNPAVQKFRSEFIALASKSVKEEVKKYSEALDSLMRERIKVYMSQRLDKEMDFSAENDVQIMHIINRDDYKAILKQEEQEFHLFYNMQIEEHAPRFVQNLVNAYFKSNLNSLTKMPTNDRLNLLYNSVDALNEEVFKNKMDEVKEMMHMGVLEV